MLAQIVQFFTGKNKSIIDNLNKKADKSKKERKGKAASKADKEKTATAGESPGAVKRAALFKKNSLLNQSQINVDKYMPGEALDARVLSIEMEQHLKEKSLERRKQSLMNYQKANLSGEILQRTVKAGAHTRLMERMAASLARSRMPTFAIYSRLDKHLIALMLIRATEFEDYEIKSLKERYFNPDFMNQMKKEEKEGKDKEVKVNGKK